MYYLHMHERLHRPGWSRMYCLYCGHVQAREWIVTVHALLAGKVLDGDWRGFGIVVRCLPRAHALFRRQCIHNELYLQPRLHWSQRRVMHSLQCGDV